MLQDISRCSVLENINRAFTIILAQKHVCSMCLLGNSVCSVSSASGLAGELLLDAGWCSSAAREWR